MRVEDKSEKTLKEIAEPGKMFRIPRYQRGYRWQRINVVDLLNDLWEFLNDDRKTYSLQPLVVKDKGTYWSVVDGQQRLTTLKILLNYLEPDCEGFQIVCDSRPQQQFGCTDCDTNIDQYHVNRASRTIEKWFGEDADKKQRFVRLFQDQIAGKRVKFIWFETPEDDEVKTFIRLNKNKIQLTNAELIKAVLLRKGNFEYESLLMQKNIASKWNEIEDMFQDEAFWYFLRPKSDKRVTRIDYLFELIRQKNLLNYQPDKSLIGTDAYSTFRYFDTFFKAKQSEFSQKQGEGRGEAFALIWKQVLHLFNIFVHWFNDVELYHYIGWLVYCNPDAISSLLDKWCASPSAQAFKQALYVDITHILGQTADLSTVYEIPSGPRQRVISKRACFPLLLLFNVESILVRNRNLQQIAQVQTPHKFPFYLFKKGKWDIEHIASNTENEISDPLSQQEWLKTFLLDNQLDEDLFRKVVLFLKRDEGDFNALKEELQVMQRKVVHSSEQLQTDQEKNRIWNYCLLDESTNCSYGNSIFPFKRRVIMGKELGERYSIQVDLIDDAKEITRSNTRITVKKNKNLNTVAYVPVCTMNVFLKAYTAVTTSSREWTRKDAEAYQEQIYETLHEKFGIKKPTK